MTHRTSKAVLTFICILLIFGGSIYILGRNHNNSVNELPSIYVLEGPEPGVATLQYKFVDEAGEEVH